MVGKIHKYNRNEETGDLRCPYCEYETLKQNTMSEHVRRKHAEKALRPIMANVCHCGRTFQTKTELCQHLNSKTHASDETSRFECPDCHEKMSKRESLVIHYVRSHLQGVRLKRQIDPFHSQCCHCEKIMKSTSMTYHVGVCNPASPFAKPSKKSNVNDDEFSQFLMFICRAAQHQ